MFRWWQDSEITGRKVGTVVWVCYRCSMEIKTCFEAKTSVSSEALVSQPLTFPKLHSTKQSLHSTHHLQIASQGPIFEE